MRSGALERAIVAFESVPPASALGEDAAYWRAIAQVRAGHRGDGQRALSRFLAHYPRAIRRGSVLVALGWICLEDGDAPQARRHFEEAAEDQDAHVRESARKGLKAASVQTPASPLEHP